VAECFTFERFVLDTHDRRLKDGNRAVDLNGRYFDALALLVGEGGRLVSKDRFLTEVWRGVPVTDEALTQCIRTLRRQLGDDAAKPRFIETVPKHGYRFIAPVALVEARHSAVPKDDGGSWREFLITGLAGTGGGALAGLIGGLIYGLVAASQQEVGATSALLVLVSTTLLVAILGAAGVSFAVGTAALARSRSWTWLVVAGGGGGLVIGAFVKMLSLDAFNLLVGRAPGEITGAMEGVLLGAAVGAARALALRIRSVRKIAAAAAAIGALAGIVITALGGRLMLGSLELFTRGFPGSRLHLDQIDGMFGETAFGPLTRYTTSALEGALFCAGVIATMAFVERRRER
jgi:DNA-binding winged helix-turn-helix (wHTH) protein